MATNASTNSPAETNTAAGTNMVEQTVAPQAPPANSADSNSAAAVLPDASPAPVATTAGRAVRHLAALVGAVALLGLLLTYDLTHFMGARAINYLFDDLGEGARDPEYERAEQTWVNGQHLEAIEMMREYLRKNPRDQFVALRIAEIYEKDLNNLVAASLEYRGNPQEEAPG